MMEVKKEGRKEVQEGKKEGTEGKKEKTEGRESRKEFKKGIQRRKEGIQGMKEWKAGRKGGLEGEGKRRKCRKKEGGRIQDERAGGERRKEPGVPPRS